MKKVLNYLLSGLLVLAFFYSCELEPTESRDFVGDWVVTEIYTGAYASGEDYYDITISQVMNSSTELTISNFAGQPGLEVVAKSNGTLFTIVPQTVNYDGELYSLSGSGRLSGDRLYYDYEMVNGWTGDCTAERK